MNPALQQALVLAIQRQVVAEFVHQHPDQKTDIHHAAFQHVGRRRGGHNALVVQDLVDRAGVFEDDVAARALGQAVGDLLADAHAQLGRDGLDLGVCDRNDLPRHVLAKAQARVSDGPVPGLLALVGDRLGGGFFRRWRLLYTEGREQIALYGGVDVPGLLGLSAEQLAFEPLQLLLHDGKIGAQLRIFLLQFRDPLRCRQFDLSACFYCEYFIPYRPFRPPFDSVFAAF